MQSTDVFVLARVLHVLGVVAWIGGVAFVTTVLLPALRGLDRADDRLALFERLEGRFALQARITTLVTGISGFYMLHFLHAWTRYGDPHYAWIHLMTLVWAIFTLVLFVLEPLVLHRWFHELARRDDARFAHIAAWEHRAGGEPRRHAEPLAFTHVQPSRRDYR